MKEGFSISRVFTLALAVLFVGLVGRGIAQMPPVDVAKPLNDGLAASKNDLEGREPAAVGSRTFESNESPSQSILRLEPTSLVEGTAGDVYLTAAQTPYTGTGVLLQSKPSWPYIVAKTGTSDANSAFAVYTSTDQPIFRVRSDGKVGIGTASPTYKLMINGGTWNDTLGLISSDGYGPSVTLQNTGTGGRQFNLISTGSWASPGAGFLAVHDGTQGAYRLVIGSNGLVGVATVTPAAVLDVAPDFASSVFRIFQRNPADTNVAATIRHASTNILPHWALLRLQRDVSTVGSGAGLHFVFNDSAAAAVEYAGVAGIISSNVASQHAGDLAFLTSAAGQTRVERMRVTANGNVGIGTSTPATKLQVVGDLNATGTISGGIINAKYQDVAEWVPSGEELSPGTVVVLSKTASNTVTASRVPYDTAVAGVVSAQPGLVLGEAGTLKELVATTGRVKVRVDATNAPIQLGDLLVTSDRPGIAMKSWPVDVGGIPMHRPGTIIGKALEPLQSGEGEILVLLSLQ